MPIETLHDQWEYLKNSLDSVKQKAVDDIYRTDYDGFVDALIDLTALTTQEKIDIKDLFYKRAMGEIKGDLITASERATLLSLWNKGELAAGGDMIAFTLAGGHWGPLPGLIAWNRSG